MLELAIAVPILTAVMEVLKRAFLPSRFVQLVAVVLGVVYSVFGNGAVTFDSVVLGVILGLSASGLYDGATHPVIKTTATKVMNIGK